MTDGRRKVIKKAINRIRAICDSVDIDLVARETKKGKYGIVVVDKPTHTGYWIGGFEDENNKSDS